MFHSMSRGTAPAPSKLDKAVAAVLRGQVAIKDLRQTDIEKATGISQAQLSRMLNGLKIMSFPQLTAICDAIQVDLQDVIGAAKEMLESQNGNNVRVLRPITSQVDATVTERAAARTVRGTKKDDDTDD
jgi:DNA-binding Xre family transcriptional regulator